MQSTLLLALNNSHDKVVNIFFVMWFGGVTIYLYIVKYFRKVKRYFDPTFMQEVPKPVLAGNLPEVFQPFNAMKEIDMELSLESI